MADNLEVIRHIIEFHHTVRSNLEEVTGSINDFETLFKLRNEYAGWGQSSLGKLKERQERLQSVFIRLEEGLQKHFAYEEDTLPPILGEIIMNGLLVEHRAVRDEIAITKVLIFDTKFDKMGLDSVILNKSRFQQAIINLSQHIEKHANREEIVLDMAREGLEGH